MPSPNHNSDSTGCFSAVLHRLLCRTGVPTHPTSSDLNHAPSVPRHSDKTDDVSPSVDEKPGIVARLMGLETLPEDFTTRRRTAVDRPTVPRSRSVNFMDYLVTGAVEHHHHRRVRTSVSFRDQGVVPRQQTQSEGNLVLYLDELDVVAESSSFSLTSKNAGKEVKLQKKMKKDGKLLRDDEKNVVISKLKNKEQVRDRGKSNSISTRVKDGARANHEDDDCKRRSAKGRLIHQREVVAESNFITKKKASAESKQKRLEEISGLHDDNIEGNSTPENMRSYLRNMSSTTRRADGSSSPEKKHVKEGNEKIDSPETHDYSLDACLDHVFRLTEKDIISNNGFGAKECHQASDELSPEYEEMCVMIEKRILNIMIQQLLGDLLLLN